MNFDPGGDDDAAAAGAAAAAASAVGVASASPLLNLPTLGLRALAATSWPATRAEVLPAMVASRASPLD